MTQPRRRTRDEDELQRLAKAHIKPLGDAKLLGCWVDSPYTFAVTFSRHGETYTQFVKLPIDVSPEFAERAVEELEF